MATISAHVTPKSLPISDAEHWEMAARSCRLEAKRASSLESINAFQREALECERLAAAIRASHTKPSIDINQREDMTTKILNQSQAEAVYSAMCALNNVGGALSATIEGVRVEETHSGAIQLWTVRDDRRERYTNQAAFATAYGLHQET